MNILIKILKIALSILDFWSHCQTTFKSGIPGVKVRVIDTEIPILFMETFTTRLHSYLPWPFLLLLIIIPYLLFLSFPPPPSSTVPTLSQGFLQTSKFPQSSGGKLLRCHGSFERERATERKGRLSHNWDRKREDKMKEEKKEERSCWWYPRAPLCWRSALCPAVQSSSVY